MIRDFERFSNLLYMLVGFSGNDELYRTLMLLNCLTQDLNMWNSCSH